MKDLCVVAVVSIASALSINAQALAADLPERATYRAPPAPIANWTGFYVGLGLGARWDNVDGSVSAATNNGINILCAPGTIGPCTGTQLDDASFRISGYLGYNWQVSPSWVVGIEGDFGWADNKKTLQGAIYPGGNFPFYLTQRTDDFFTFKSNWDGGIRGRIGYLINPSALLFAAGGVQWMQIETESRCGVLSDCLPGVFAFLFAPANISHTETRVGWTIGGGIEWMVTPNWLVRGEYRYADFGRATFTDTRVNPAGPVTQVATYSVDVVTHTALFGIAYKFSPAVVAWY
jgi:outer membrane immunogenic protein